MTKLPNNVPQCAHMTLKSLGYRIFRAGFGAPEYNIVFMRSMQFCGRTEETQTSKRFYNQLSAPPPSTPSSLCFVFLFSFFILLPSFPLPVPQSSLFKCLVLIPPLCYFLSIFLLLLLLSPKQPPPPQFYFFSSSMSLGPFPHLTYYFSILLLIRLTPSHFSLP